MRRILFLLRSSWDYTGRLIKIRDYVEHLEKNGWVSDFDELSPEIAKKFKAIERRLRMFQNESYN